MARHFCYVVWTTPKCHYVIKQWGTTGYITLWSSTVGVEIASQHHTQDYLWDFTWQFHRVIKKRKNEVIKKHFS